MVFYISFRNSFRKIQISGGIMMRLQYDQEYMVKKWTCLYQVVFIICWLPSVIYYLWSFSTSFGPNSGLVDSIFTIAWALITPLHGFFNCIIYGWRRRGFTGTLQTQNYQSITENSST
ncbi:cyclic AMP receptor-like protein C [Exaiptasia diaphana]|uniref:Uncharacterized protein n=1 Tax=Exaiptasia diaphana TaxID=2652724 RepID=A0A913WZX1_EXADI|nr:cyclic AMP receptor-like protein C [Exaiptasia diaphana]